MYGYKYIFPMFLLYLNLIGMQNYVCLIKQVEEKGICVEHNMYLLSMLMHIVKVHSFNVIDVVLYEYTSLFFLPHVAMC